MPFQAPKLRQAAPGRGFPLRDFVESTIEGRNISGRELTLYKGRFFGYPDHPASFSQGNLLAFYNSFTRPFVAVGLTEQEYAQIRDEKIELIFDSWKDTAPFVKAVLRNAFEIAKELCPLESRRQTGVPKIFHYLENADIQNRAYSDADTVAAGLFHDIFEDELAKKKDREDYLVRRLSDTSGLDSGQQQRALVLAQCIVWHVRQLTHFKKKDEVEASKIIDGSFKQPEDWFKHPQVTRALETIIKGYRDYLGNRYQDLPDATQIKSGDTFSNTFSLRELDPGKDLVKMFMAIVKAFQHVEIDRKLNYVLPWYTIENIAAGISRLDDYWGRERMLRAFFPFAESPIKGWELIRLNYAIHRQLSYHQNEMSREQKFYNDLQVTEPPPRAVISTATLRDLAHTRSPVVQLHVPSKNYFYNIAPLKIEVGFPRFIGSGNPMYIWNFMELDQNKVVNVLNAQLSSSGLPFEAKYVESVMRGHFGYEFINVRLEFPDQSKPLYPYLGTQDPYDFGAQANAYGSMIDKLNNILKQAIENDFSKVRKPASI